MKKFFLPLIFLLSLQAPAVAGVKVWARSYLEPMHRDAEAPDNLSGKIVLRVTPGEYEPASFAIRSDKQIQVNVDLSGLEGSDWLPASWCELHRVGSLEKDTAPNRLYEIVPSVELEPGRTEFFWLTVYPPSGARPGTYEGRIFIKAYHEMKQLEITCEVLHFKLVKSPIIGGVFMDETNLPKGWYCDMKEHGLDAIQYFWAWKTRVVRRGEEIFLDLSPMERMMADIQASGMKGPVVISLGNDYHLHFERRIAEAFDIPIDTLEMIGGKAEVGPAVSPRLDSLFVRGLRRVRDLWQEKEYPQELVVLIYDEPTERLLARGKNRYDLLKTVMPDTRVYGVVMNRGEWAESMADQCDIIVSNGDFKGCRQVAEKYGKDFWIYGFPLNNIHTSRYDMGVLPWRVGAQGVFFWMYNYYSYDLDNCAVYRHPDDPDKLVRSAPWEGIREGMDDLRYLATAEKFIARSLGEKRRIAQRRLGKLRESIDPRRRRPAPRGEAHDETSRLKHYSEAQRVRGEVIKIILDLL